MGVNLTDEQRASLVEVLIYHQRTGTGKCSCGWGDLGRSFAEHVVSVFEMEQ
jgi:hypothetical protein